MANAKQAKLVVLGITLFFVIAVLGIGIATVVKVYQKPKSTVNEDGLSNKPNALNVPPAFVIDQQAGAERYEAFESYVKTLKNSLNIAVNPCDDFYAYTCSALKEPDSFSTAEQYNYDLVWKQAQKEQFLKPGQYAAYHLNKCIEAHKDASNKIYRNGQTVKDMYNEFSTKANLKFPLFNRGWKHDNLTAKEFGQAVGYLSGRFGVETFLQIDVGPNWSRESNQANNSYRLTVDQTQLAFPDSFYLKAWPLVKDSYQNATFDLFSRIASALNINLDQVQMEQDVNAIFEMENWIAGHINTPANKKRQFQRQNNVRTIEGASAEFSLIDFKTYFNNALLFASAEARGLINGAPGYQFNLKEPKQLAQLGDYLLTKVQPRTIVNYFFLRLFREHINFVEDGQVAQADVWMRKTEQRTRKKAPRHIYHPSELESDQDIGMRCNSESMDYLGFINSRMLLDERFEGNSQRRSDIHDHVALIIEKVLDGFRNQLDQISWMSERSKRGAYDKIKYLVRNVAYPNKIFDDHWINAYYENLNIDLNSQYLDVLTRMKQFAKFKQFEPLTTKSGLVRDDFGMSPSAVNAWYQSELNSITFPIGILQRPFYDLNYPASVNFGAIGLVGGHELGHGFDDEGSQYSGAGYLESWMDDSTQSNFDEMASCVRAQYNQFSPTPNFTIDGTQTLGENLADSAGLRAAYNAYKAHEDFYGPDARLPDGKLDGFTHEQLFFLSFARIWCESPPTREEIIQQVLTNEHSPNEYRVLGSIQNFPAFRTAFNCHEGTKYAPIDARRCPVWASEVKTVTGVPNVDSNDPLQRINNVDPPKEVQSKQYQRVAQRLRAAVNTSYVPCDNFLSYACGNYDQTDQSTLQKAHSTVRSAVTKAARQTVNPGELHYITLTKQYFNACMNYDRTSNQFVKAMIGLTESLLDQKFPAFTANVVFKPLDPTQLATAFSTLNALYNTDILFKSKVKPLQKRFALEKPYSFYLDQPHLTYDKAWYEEKKKKDDFQQLLKNHIKNIFTRYSNAIGQTIDNSKIETLANETAQYEIHFANLVENEYTRQPDYDPQRLDNFTRDHTQVNYGAYFDWQFQVTNEAKPYDTTSQAYIIVEATKYFKNLDLELISVGDGDKLRIFYNFIFYRLLDSNVDLLPGNSEFASSSAPSQEEICGEALSDQLPLLYARLAISALYNGDQEFQDAQSLIGEIADSVQRGFTTMLDSVPWLDRATRKRAHAKIDAVTRNIGAPNLVLNTADLTSAYKDVQFVDKDSLPSNVLDLNRFEKKRQLQLFTQTGDIDRGEFRYNQYPEPIWSDYDLNSITFTLDVLQEPFYSANYPSAFNFGFLGTMIGHELGHAMDQIGVQFDATGQRMNWFDATKDFDQMKTCITDQYSGYCWITGGDKPQCMKKEETFNDNLADNVGLQAALRGFRNWVALKGQDGRLPDDVLDRFSNEQLFFLGYAQQFCPTTNLTWYSYGAKQATNEYRLMGTLTNSQVFRSAYNCQKDKQYTKRDPCPIWSGDYTPVLNPVAETPAPNMNIPVHDKSGNTDGPFKQCSDAIEKNIDTRVDPCKDFYSYVCKRHTGESTLVDLEYRNTEKIIDHITKLKNDYTIRAGVQEKIYFDKCVEAYKTPAVLGQGAHLPATFIQNFYTFVNVRFPLTVGNPDTDANPQTISQAIGFLSSQYAKLFPLIQISQLGDIYYPELGYLPVLVAPNLIKNIADYQAGPDESAKQQAALSATMQANLKAYFRGVGIQIPDDLKAETDQMAKLESLLTVGIVPDPAGSSSPDYAAFYNIFTIDNSTTAINGFLSMADIFIGLSSKVPEIQAQLKKGDFRFMVTSPDNLKTLSNTLSKLSTPDFPIKPKTLWNYLYYRIIDATSNYLPTTTEISLRSMLSMDEPLFKGPPGIKPKTPHPPKGHPVYEQYAYTNEQYNCYNLAKEVFQEVNNRLFLERMFKDREEIERVRNDVAKFGDLVINSVRAMVDQVTWLGTKSRQRVNEKMDLVARNMLYPAITFNDTELNKFYQGLELKEDTAQFTDMLLVGWQFSMRRELLKYSYTGGVDRGEFGDTTIVNAFYNPVLNSITILAGITHQPAYDEKWPKAFLYGAFGLVLGHEMHHGLDPSGIRFDGTGRYNNILDNDGNTLTEYNKVKECIETEYTGMCLVGKSGTQHCVNGPNTVGENFGDNGGIQAAYRAYHSVVDFSGEESRLPGPITSQFTNDQLFFIGFARTWCNPDDKDPDTYVWGDVHSPDPFRIYGSLQNFEAFRAAFNCPKGSAYAPDKEPCRVWITDVIGHKNVPTLPPQQPKVNLPEPAVAPSDNASYKAVANHLSTSIDIGQQPCEKFYEYTCNKLQDVSDIQQINLDVAKKMVEEIGKISMTDATPVPNLKKIRNYYDGCYQTLQNVPDPHLAPVFVADFLAGGGLVFPLINPPASPLDFPSKDQLGKALGYLAGVQGISAFLGVRVVKRFETIDDNSHDYILNFGEPVLTHPVHYYIDTITSPATMKDKIIGVFVDILTAYCTASHTTITPDLTEKIRQTAEGMYKIEEALARAMSNYVQRNDPTQMETLKTLAEIITDHPVINWVEFITAFQVLAPPRLQAAFGSPANYKVTEPAGNAINAAFAAIASTNTKTIEANDIYNYLNFRVIWELRNSLIPLPNDGSLGLPVLDSADDLKKYACALETRVIDVMHSRVFVNRVLPTQADRDTLKSEVAKVANRVIGALKSQIQQTSWLAPLTVYNATFKLDNVTVNTLFNGITFDDAKLDAYYADLAISDPMNQHDVLKNFRTFYIKQQFNLLLSETKLDRNLFVGSSSDPKVNYNPLTNSLSIPATVAMAPYFNVEYPLAAKYGGLGYQIAHELAHSFDKFGIQFNGTGGLSPLLVQASDPNAVDRFSKIVKCLNDQYTRLCPLDDAYSPKCPDGDRSLNENIADNTGIHAAYNAYLAATNFLGEDARLSGDVLKQFSERQLFFMTYVRNLCKRQTKDQIFADLVAGVVPPSVRVQGMLQNFPAFRSAFNCPATSAYVKQGEICNVWTSDISSAAWQVPG